MTVIRYIATLIIATLAIISSSAETHYKPQIRVGGKAGLTMSEMSFSPTVKQKMVDGIIVGATFHYAEEKLFGLRAELCIEQRGWQEDYEEQSSLFSYKRQLTYIQLPLLTQIQFGSAKFKGIITLGPEVSYMISDNINANFDYHNIGTLTDYPTVNRMNEQLTMQVARKFDYGISAGAGMQWNVTRRHAVSLEGRFYYGLGNIFSDRRSDVFSASRGMSIQLTVGYNLRLK